MVFPRHFQIAPHLALLKAGRRCCALSNKTREGVSAGGILSMVRQALRPGRLSHLTLVRHQGAADDLILEVKLELPVFPEGQDKGGEVP